MTAFAVSLGALLRSGSAGVGWRGPVGLPEPLTHEAQDLTHAWRIFLVVGAMVAVFVYLLMAFVVIRYRRRDDRLPEQVHNRIPIEIAYTVLPALIVVGLVIVTVRAVRDTQHTTANPDVVVDVLGSQWTWTFGYEGGPSGDGSLSGVPELVLPVDSTVRFNVRTGDVIHSFWVPGFLYKRDLIPGEIQSFDVTTSDVTGTFEGRCAEFCGLGHAAMHFVVRIVSQDEFATWWGQQ